jgi:catechol 2,3-dioxygenase-like lactoylglutathione lyase family enzyme
VLGDSTIIALIATADAARSRAFYEGTLGLHFIADEPYALVCDVNGAMLRIAKRSEVAPAPYSVLGWTVDDIESAVRGLTERGVTFERYAGMEQDELAIWDSGSALVAWFKDPDGNLLSLTEFKYEQ